ncbi:hypothetical protein FACS18949_11180 [Clostridia bacterium]|nr:hypothetical protein FACS18949_11180 [Clostridia bacterium]
MTYALIAGHISWVLKQVTRDVLPKAARLFISGRGAEEFCEELQRAHGVAALPNPARSHLERADAVILCEERELTFNPKAGASVLRCEVDNMGNLRYNSYSQERADINGGEKGL